MQTDILTGDIFATYTTIKTIWASYDFEKCDNLLILISPLRRVCQRKQSDHAATDAASLKGLAWLSLCERWLMSFFDLLQTSAATALNRLCSKTVDHKNTQGLGHSGTISRSTKFVADMAPSVSKLAPCYDTRPKFSSLSGPCILSVI